MTFNNFFWFFKVIHYCKYNNFPINEPKSKNMLFQGPKIPVTLEQVKFKHGWRWVASNKEKELIIKFPAHYSYFGVYNYLFNQGFSHVE